MKFLLNILIAVYFLLPLSSAWSMKECPGSPLKTKYSSIPSSWHNCEGTFILTDEPVTEPPKKLDEALKRYDLTNKDFFVLSHGETYLID